MQAVTIVQITPPELESLIESSLRKILSSEKTALPPTDTDKILTVQEAAELLHLSVPTIYALVSKSEIPVNKKSKRLYFSKKELIDWVKAGRKKTNTETAAETDEFLSTVKRKAAKHG